MARRLNVTTNPSTIEIWQGGKRRYRGKLRFEMESPASLETLLQSGGKTLELRFPSKRVKAYGVLAPAEISAPPTPAAPELGEVTAFYADLTWPDPGDVSAWTVYNHGAPVTTVTSPVVRVSGFEPQTPQSIQIQASNAGGSSGLSPARDFTSAANSPPIWLLGEHFGVIGEPFSLDLDEVSEDFDGHAGTYSIASGAVDGLALVGSVYSGVFQSAQVVDVTFRRSDGYASSDGVARFTVTDPDVTKPTPPANVQGVADGSTVTLTSDGSTDASGISHYRAFRDGQFRANLSAFPYIESGVPDGQYAYTFTAVDASANANESDPSAPAVVDVAVTPPMPDVPINLAVNAVSPTQIDGSFEPGPSGPTPTGYDVRRGTGPPGAPNTDGVIILPNHQSLSFSDPGLTPDSDYWYVVRARNGDTVESAYSPRAFAKTPPVIGDVTFIYTSTFDALAAGRAIQVVPGGYQAAGGSGTNPNGWLHQHCDNLGDDDAPAGDADPDPPNLRGNYPWAAQVVTAGQTVCTGYRRYATATTLGQLTNVFPAPAPAPRNGTKCLRLEYRPGENPLPNTGPRSQFKRVGLFGINVEAWIGFSIYMPLLIGNFANQAWPIGPGYHLIQIFETGFGAGGPGVGKIKMSPTAFAWRISAENENGNIVTNGFGGTNHPFNADAWNDVVMRIKRNPVGQQGIFEIWINGAKRCDYVSAAGGLGRDADAGGNCDFLMCLYAGPPALPIWVYFDEVRIALASQGGSFDTVNPANY